MPPTVAPTAAGKSEEDAAAAEAAAAAAAAEAAKAAEVAKAAKAAEEAKAAAKAKSQAAPQRDARRPQSLVVLRYAPTAHDAASAAQAMENVGVKVFNVTDSGGGGHQRWSVWGRAQALPSEHGEVMEALDAEEAKLRAQS